MNSQKNKVLCPSSQPSQEHGVIFGVVGGTPEAPEVHYLQETQPAVKELFLPICET
ncbi:MAG: hypothetical protein AB4426_33105 [Xenococcaceae cyanobacterium]